MTTYIRPELLAKITFQKPEEIIHQDDGEILYGNEYLPEKIDHLSLKELTELYNSMKTELKDRSTCENLEFAVELLREVISEKKST